MEDDMRQGEKFEDATHLAAKVPPKNSSRRKFWRGGLVETIATFRYRDEAAYEEWLEERDMLVISAALSRLSDRQLARIGLSRETLVIDIEDLRRLADRDRRIGHDVVTLIEDLDADKRSQKDDGPERTIAAE
jgi:uncharacterized protein YjiS (DUF1127 family)